MVIIGTSSTRNGVGLPPASPLADGVDAMLAHVGLNQFLLDLRPARADRASIAWLMQPHPLRANFNTFLTLTPGTAFDVILFVSTLTPAHTLARLAFL